MSDDSEFLPATSWVLDKVVTAPAENLPAGAAIPYFVVAGPVIGLGALGAYAVDEYNHYFVEPAKASLERVAEITGVSDAVDAAVHETASTMVDLARLTLAAAPQDVDPATAVDPYADAMCHPDPASAPDPVATGGADDGGMCPADAAGGDAGAALQ